MIRPLDSKLGDRSVGIVFSALLFVPALIFLIVLKTSVPSHRTEMMAPLITWLVLTGAALLFYSVFYANTPSQPAYSSISKHDK